MAITVSLRRKKVSQVNVLGKFYSWVIYVEHDSFNRHRELDNWCRENLPRPEHHWNFNYDIGAFMFAAEKDAFLFYMTWQGTVIEGYDY